MLPVLSFLLAAVLLRYGDTAKSLQEMKQAFRQAGAIQARLVIQETLADAPPRVLRQEIWIDLVEGRVRSEVRDPRRPEPHLTLIAGPKGLLLYHADAREVSQQPGSLDLGAALDASLAGELWRTAFRGDLAGMKVESYGSPRTGEEETVADTTCLKIEFPGNQLSTLWVSQEDHLPRRLVGPLPGMVRQEEVQWLARTARAPDEWFRFVPPPGVRVVPLALARQNWSQLPPERERWPSVGQPLPAFQALGPDAQERTAEDLSLPCVLAFWFDEHPAVRASLAEVEKGMADGLLPLHSIHAGLPREERLHRSHEIWWDGAGEQRPFWIFAVASCPVFFLVDEEGKIHTATADAGELLTAARNFDGAP